MAKVLLVLLGKICSACSLVVVVVGVEEEEVPVPVKDQGACEMNYYASLQYQQISLFFFLFLQPNCFALFCILLLILFYSTNQWGMIYLSTQ
jgi:hypothetical protein